MKTDIVKMTVDALEERFKTSASKGKTSYLHEELLSTELIKALEDRGYQVTKYFKDRDWTSEGTLAGYYIKW